MALQREKLSEAVESIVLIYSHTHFAKSKY